MWLLFPSAEQSILLTQFLELWEKVWGGKKEQSINKRGGLTGSRNGLGETAKEGTRGSLPLGQRRICFNMLEEKGDTSYLVLIVGHCPLTARGVAEVTSPAGSIFLSSILVRWYSWKMIKKDFPFVPVTHPFPTKKHPSALMHWELVPPCSNQESNKGKSSTGSKAALD